MIDERDRVVPLKQVPSPNTSAPSPILLSSEDSIVVNYESVIKNIPLSVFVQALSHYAVLFGPPNTEEYLRHPLASRGLAPFGAYLIEESSWTAT